MLLEGLFIPLTTPYLPDGRLHTRKLKDNVARYSKTPAAGLVVLSSNGQPSLLSDVETRLALQAVAESAAPEKVLLAGIARDSVQGVLDLISFASDHDYDAALVPVPSLHRSSSSSKEVSTFFAAVADRSRLPVVLDGDIDTRTVLELALHRNIIGMVDSIGDATRTADVLQGTREVKHQVTVTPIFAAVTGRMLAKSSSAAMLVSANALSSSGTALSIAPPSTETSLKTRSKAIGFQVLCGRTTRVLNALRAGAVGAVPPLAACAPQACYEVLAAWKDGDPALAEEKQQRIDHVATQLEVELGVAAIKYGCDLNGYFGGRPRLPGLPLTGEQRARVDQFMAAIRN